MNPHLLASLSVNAISAGYCKKAILVGALLGLNLLLL